MWTIRKNTVNSFRVLSTYSGSLIKKYELVKKVFHHDAILFSRPIFDKNQVSWVIPKETSLDKYTDLSEDKQNHAKHLLKQQVTKLYNTKIVQEDEDYYELLEYLLEIPNLENIYLAGEQVILTNWGHIEDRYNAPRKIINELIQGIEIIPESIYKEEDNRPEKVLITEQKTMEGKRGDPRINLKWYDHNDLDLYVIDPCENQIDFMNRESICQDLKGVLDVDANVSEDHLKDNPQENIVWENGGPKGLYHVLIKDAKNRTGKPSSFKLTIINNGEVLYYDGYIAVGEFKQITTFEH